MEDHVGSTTHRGRLVAGLLGLFAATALILAGVGLYGVMSGVAAERTREIAVRLAIGAQGSQVVVMILRQAMTSVVIGAALGLALSTSSHSWLRACFWDHPPRSCFLRRYIPVPIRRGDAGERVARIPGDPRWTR